MSVHPEPTDRAEVQKLANAVEVALAEALATPTRYRDDTPVPVVGTTPPVAQPGRPPMSQKATDASALMLSAGASSLLLGGAASLVLLASGQADPVVVACFCGAPPAFLLAMGSLVKRVKEAAKETLPDVHHHHYTGKVVQHHRTTNNHTRGVWAKTNITNNEQQ
jgi:hypothetical protein